MKLLPDVMERLPEVVKIVGSCLDVEAMISFSQVQRSSQCTFEKEIRKFLINKFCVMKKQHCQLQEDACILVKAVCHIREAIRSGRDDDTLDFVVDVMESVEEYFDFHNLKSVMADVELDSGFNLRPDDAERLSIPQALFDNHEEDSD